MDGGQDGNKYCETKLVNKTIKRYNMAKQRDRDRKLFAKSVGQYQWQGKEVMRVG